MNVPRRTATTATALALLFWAVNALPCSATERWDVAEISIRGPSGGNPYLDVQWSATFTQGNQSITVPGFWDKEGTYTVRFSPPGTGEWRYETRSATPELNGNTGVVAVTAPTGNNHGPVRVSDTYYLRYADGTPYHQFGTTCYAWVHQPRELQEQTLQTLAASPFNKIRFCVFPKSYEYNRNEPEFFAFKRKADGKFDFSRPDPVFWRHFEERIVDLQRLEIEADIILWHPYDHWGFADMSDEEDDRYLRYCIARLSAFRNVWWSLANEYDFMTDRPKGHRGNKQWEDWDRFFSILQKEDPHERLRGIHNGSKWYDHTKAWVTHASLQTSDMNQGVGYRAQYRKPVLYDECRYEGDIPQGWGNLKPREMLQKFWLGTLSGCYVGHGETYKHPQDILWWAKGGVLRGQSPKRIQWLKDLMAQAPAFHELQPLADGKGTFVLAKPGEYYLVYCLNQRAQQLRLAGTSPYKVDLLDPWDMTVVPAGTASPGDCTVSAPKPDVVYRFTPYRPGEKLRPEAKIVASATEGLPPLTVKFASPAAGQAQWDFGDGAKSQERTPTHVFQNPGLYSVRLTIKDADGGSAQAFQLIAVDRQASEPILRAGLPGVERPELQLHGTARRTTDGSLHLRDGAPWGWVQVNDTVRQDLRGLRSFTVMGWLKPESLQAGSGGNRVLFCLQENRSGIDLVCHNDGRLRLAVNEWPDSIRNDSSPGKLQVGKWTFFAVSYDAMASGENVSWYFSAPVEAPRDAAVLLDRKTAYHAGPVDGDVGPLAIGNFNDTMHSYGLDRQFRGELRALQLFGSRVGGRGALSAEEIKTHFRSSSGSVTPGSSVGQAAARWRPQTTNWSEQPNLVIGDWGCNRPGFPDGLYIHGITRPAGDKIINPVIYDNDVYDDVFDDEVAFVMASEGEMNLAGLIITPVLTDGWGFSKPDWIKTAHEARRTAELSGLDMKRIPPVTVGTEAASERAGENKLSEGARLYVRLINEQFERDPQRPVIVNIGGQGATLASAFGLDPSIAGKCVVYYTDLRVYNGHYEWASKVVAKHFRVVSWGDDNWWINKPAQNQWRVLPRPEKAEGKDNDANSGEWRQFSQLHVPLLDHMIKQFQTRGEYCQGPRKGDGYLDGTFLHAWLPGIFSGAALKEVRGGEVLHVTSFTATNEDRVKAFANRRLLNPRAYQRTSADAPARTPGGAATRLVREIQLSQATNTVEVYDDLEVTIRPDQPVSGNPFTDVTIEGEFALATNGSLLEVRGFCDSQDGAIYRIRFMPAQPGDYHYQVTLRQGEHAVSGRGTFTAKSAWKRGLLRVDPGRPFHFLWEGTGEHYFWNGTTTYYLMGWQSEEQIRKIIDRLSGLRVNRIRVLLYGRNEDRPWGQPIKSTEEFKLYLNPWLAERPDNVKDPGFDLHRFNLVHWQRYERMLAYARQKGMIVSVIPWIAAQVLPTPFKAFSEEEQLYYRYAVARLAAFCNITWDLGNEHDLNRKEPGWADWLGPMVKQWDPYHHLTGAHNRIYRTPGNPWNDMQLIQHWDGGIQKDFFLEQRKQQIAFGRIVPLINEEYGYEDLWEKKPGERNADTRRRVAWEVCMAGGYQTTGETVSRGTGFPPDSGGGWVNGRGDDSMKLLRGNAHLATFFTGFDWWLAEPHNELVEGPATCLAQPGQVYAVYLPNQSTISVKLEGTVSYRARWFNPRTGEWAKLPDASGPQWTSPLPATEGDWALLLTSYDWRGVGSYDSTEQHGLQFNNNRWGGENGNMFVRFGPPAVTWWTTHTGNRPEFPVSEPNVSIGNNWGRITQGSPLPMKIKDIEVFTAIPQKNKKSWNIWFCPATRQG